MLALSKDFDYFFDWTTTNGFLAIIVFDDTVDRHFCVAPIFHILSD